MICFLIKHTLYEYMFFIKMNRFIAKIIFSFLYQKFYNQYFSKFLPINLK